jgi:hypothetical protein
MQKWVTFIGETSRRTLRKRMQDFVEFEGWQRIPWNIRDCKRTPQARSEAQRNAARNAEVKRMYRRPG